MLLLLVPLMALAGPLKGPAAKAGSGGAPRLQQGEPERPAVGSGGVRPGLRRGNAYLRQGYYRAAVEAFQGVITRFPEDPEAHIGLGSAQARLGRCDAALDEFVHWSDARAFGMRHALLAAGCAAQQGFAADALVFDLVAQERYPTSRTALTRVALDAHRAGESVVRDMALEYLWYVSAAQDESLFAEAALALNRGDIDEFDALVDQWNREGRSPLELARLQAQSWLDLNDPGQAVRTFLGLRRVRRGEEARIILAESLRRMGRPSEATRQLSSLLNGTVESAAADAIRVRIAVDVGDLAAADTLAAENPDVGDEDWSATEWYLARAHGDAAGMAAAAAEYSAVVASPLRTLEQLRPIVGSPPADSSGATH